VNEWVTPSVPPHLRFFFATGLEKRARVTLHHEDNRKGRTNIMHSRLAAVTICIIVLGLSPVSHAQSSGTAKAPTKEAVPAATTAQTTTNKVAAPAPKKITVVGKLTKEGVECRAMREDKTNKLYTLTGKVPFKNGTHVKVTGTISQVSICQQGTTIAVSSITQVK
jgi:hypothetical protein